jgi:hypothetical protein
MSTRRRLAKAAALGALFAVTSASASMLPAASAPLGAGDVTNAPCDPDRLTVAYTNQFDVSVADYRTSAATVSGIATACNGQTLDFTIADARGDPLWQTTATVNATTMTLTPPATLPSAAIAHWAVVITP